MTLLGFTFRVFRNVAKPKACDLSLLFSVNQTCHSTEIKFFFQLPIFPVHQPTNWNVVLKSCSMYENIHKGHHIRNYGVGSALEY